MNENCKTPVKASSRQCEAVAGSGIFRARMIRKTIAADNKNLAAANDMGGRSPRPIFIKIQVDPQIRQRTSQTIIRRIRKSGSLKKAQAGLALFQNPPAAQVARRVWDRMFRAMFDHKDAFAVQERVCAIAEIE